MSEPQGIPIPIVYKINEEFEVDAFEYPDGTIIGAGVTRPIKKEES